MDTGTSEWWRRHGWTIGLLLVAFGIAFSIRTIWTWPVIAKWGSLYTYAGGSDSYYHSRVMTYIIQTHRNLVYDPMLKFPVGAINPREPLFDWMNAILGIVFAPFFGGNAVEAGAFFLNLQAPLWAALGVFPIYLIGREVSGRRNGLIAALIYPFFSASINSSTFGYANYLSFYTFFLLIVVYAFIRTVKAVGHRRYVQSYRDTHQYVPALREFLRTERTAVKWSVFTGVAMGAFALSWQGYTYAIVIVAFTALVAMLIERIRRVDSFGLYVSTWIIGLVAFPMCAPYYLVQHEIKVFLELPIILFFGTLLLLLPFLLLRDVPWVFSIPALVAVVGGGVLALRFLSPTLFTAAITGDNYFVKNLIYSTVAEAQPPSIDALIVGYGVVTFFLAFAGLALFVYQLVHQRFKRYLIAFLLFGIISVYLPISATKFFLVAAPAYALLAAEGIHRLLDIAGYSALRRSVASLSDRTTSLAALRKSFKARHVLVMVLAVGIILPNVWIAIDAGIPSNTKGAAAQQINQTLPSWLKLNTSAPGSNYLGAAGSSLDTLGQYDSAGYTWLARQDTNLPEPQRPAVVAWWDYGFQTIDQGQHPSVADNFQNGIDPAGQFLLSQNESLAIGILATTLLQGEILASHSPTLPPALNAILTEDGVNVTALHTYLDDEAADYQLVVNNPQIYLPVNPATITDDNAMYLATSYYLANHLSLAGVSRVYDSIMSYTGWAIRYAMTDSRTFPFTGSDTGIFYAPADLTGRVISSEGVPTSFYNVTILGSDGNTYPLGPLPTGISAVQYNINWSQPFYHTMLYKIYIGEDGNLTGQGGGIPGLSGAAAGDRIMPGWMLQHFEVQYQTAYVCPGVKNASSGAACFVATNRPNATEVANRTNGTANLSAVQYFQGGESILAYYPGVTLYGNVQLPGGAPVSGVRVTVYDGWGIPHMTNVTNANGSFSLVLPPGNDTLNISYGTFDGLNQSDDHLISSVKIPIAPSVGFSPDAPAMVQSFQVANATVNGLVYWNVSGNKSYNPSTDVVTPGATVLLKDPNGRTVANVTTDSSGSFALRNLPPGAYNVTVLKGGVVFNQSRTNVSGGSTVNLSLGLSPGTVSGSVRTSTTLPYGGATVTLANASGIYETTITTSSGSYTFPAVSPGNYTVYAVGTEPTLTTNRVAVSLPKAGGTAEANLTIEARGTVEVQAQAAGHLLPNASVMFQPLVSFGNRTVSAGGAVYSATTNTTLATTNVHGIATAGLSVGNYTVSAYARVNDRLYTAVAPVNVSGPGVTPTVSLTLTPAQSVALTATASPLGSNDTAFVVYGRNGTESVGWAGSSATTTVQLPNGTYTFLAVNGGTSASSSAQVGLSTANVTGPRSITIPVGASTVARFTVGTVLADGKVYPAPNASLTLSAGAGGPVLRATADASGLAGFVLPEATGGGAGGYCLSASAFGFEANTTCGLEASALGKLTSYSLPVREVAVTLAVLGLPAGTNVTVNITGTSLGSRNLTLSGPPTFAFELPPGTYGVGAKAVISKGATLYLPSTILTTTIYLGATYSNLTLIVVPQINATGKLSVPNGVALGDVTVSLASPLLNVTVNGTNFTKTFRATPANYTATVNATVGGVPYVNISRVTVYPNGTVHPRLVLNTPGVVTNLTLTKRSGTALSVSGTATLVSSAGLVLHRTIFNGSVRGTLPAGTYGVFANLTSPTTGPNGTYYTNWTTGLTASCTFSSASPACTVPMTGSVVTVRLHGTLVTAGSKTPNPGTLRLVGPYPSTNLTVLSAPNGTFSATVQPGAYFGYAASSGSPAVAGFGRLVALPNAPLNVTIAMEPTWSASIHPALTNSTGATVGPVNVTIRDTFGDLVKFTGVNLGSSVSVALPVGTYTVKGNASGTLNGVAGFAVGSSTVSVSTGNVVSELGMAIPVATTVSGAVVGPDSAIVSPGGQATFSFTVHASGNVPVTIHGVGTPSDWSFNFSFANATLAPGENLSGEVRITVPNGTVVNHAPLSLSFNLPNGTEAGRVDPPPVVQVLGHYGLSAGTSAAVPPAVGSTAALLPFYATNSGNAFETIRLSVVDAERLASDGWTTSWVFQNSSLTGDQVNLSPAENASLALNLTATSSALIPPGSVTVEVVVVNASGSIQESVVLTVPRPQLGTLPGTFVIGGPSIASGPPALPTWFVPVIVFVPTIALLVAVVVYRWWKTRRWTRR